MKTLSSRAILLVLLVLTSMLTLTAEVWSTEKQVVGWVEKVTLFPGNLTIKAKLDTGAENSSLHAAQIDVFKRKGCSWVRFDVTDDQGRTQNFETKLVRKTKIKRKDSEPQKRPVIRIGICLGRIYKEVEVNLVNRSNFDYPMLVGRSFLKGSFVVDSEQTFTVDQNCP